MSNQKLILLVDDDPELVESNKLLLEAEGFAVQVAYDGASGLQAALKFKPDLMILDVMMATDTEGFEVSRSIPEMTDLQDMPVIILTGICAKKQLPYGFEPDETWLPCKAVLEKPVIPELLLAEVHKLLGTSRLD